MMGMLEDMFEETPERTCFDPVSTVEAEQGKEVRRSSKIGRDRQYAQYAKLTYRVLGVENIETNIANGKFK